MKHYCLLTLFCWLLYVLAYPIYAAEPEPKDLMLPGRAFKSSDRLVGIYVFHWYTPTGGQTKSVWKPVEGRQNWDGSVSFWKRHIKDILSANGDLILVHLIDTFEPQRVNLFQSLAELRAEGYRTPAVAPFLDPAITFYGPPSHQPHLDFTLERDRETFIEQYVRFYNQYTSVNTDPHADSYLADMDGKPMLNCWAVKSPQIQNRDILTRQEVLDQLRSRLGERFHNGMFWSNLIRPDGFTWADEWNRSFVGYTGDYWLRDRNTASLKPGHYDTLDRFLARNGGQGYREAWDRVISDSQVNRVLIESWNEYTEGTGLYEVANLTPDTSDPAYKDHEDSWGSDRRLYIRLTAEKASLFNNVPEQDSKFLWHNMPSKMPAGSTVTVRLILLNEGDASWTGAAGYALAQSPSDVTRFLAAPVRIDDSTHEISHYGGIFRGRPVEFHAILEAPLINGTWQTHWSMITGQGSLFGEILFWEIEVTGGQPSATQLQAR